jgi:hypothetical protein
VSADNPLNTISDDEWQRIQEETAKVTPVIDGPWVDPNTTRRTSAWKAASKRWPVN